MDKSFFRRSNLSQRRLPATFEFSGDKTIIGVHSIKLTLGQSGGVPLSLELAFGACTQCGVHLELGAASP